MPATIRLNEFINHVQEPQNRIRQNFRGWYGNDAVGMEMTIHGKTFADTYHRVVTSCMKPIE